MQTKTIILLLAISVAFCIAWTAGGTFSTGAGGGGGCESGTEALALEGSGGATGFDGYIQTGKVVADYSCTVDRIKITVANTNGAGRHFRLGIYADSSGAPSGAPLAYTAECTTTLASGNPETFIVSLNTTVSTVESTTYHLAIWMQGGEAMVLAMTYPNVSNSGSYYAATYSSTGALPTISGATVWDQGIQQIWGLAQ